MRSKLALGTLAVAATLIGSGTALAQEYKTGDQLKVELVEAIRRGDVYVVFVGDSARKANDMPRSGDPAEGVPAGQTRGPVKADPDRATRTDSISPANGGYPGYDYVLPFGE
jgi:hypothetical protein